MLAILVKVCYNTLTLKQKEHYVKHTKFKQKLYTIMRST